MADVKPVDKKDIKPVSAPQSGVAWEEVILLIFGIIALLFVFIPRFITTTDKDIVKSTNTIDKEDFNIKDTYNNIFNEQETKIFNDKGQVIGVSKTPSLVDSTKSRIDDFVAISSLLVFSIFIFLTLLFSVIIYYNKFRRDLIIQGYKKKFETEAEIKAEDGIDKNNEKIMENSIPDTNGIINPRWEIVGRYYNSANQSDWKLAILEADIMLYEVLSKSGFQGESIGEMLKNTDRSKLNTLNDAWSAHKIRNEIAHSGTDYILSRNTVERAISEYEKVFDELNYI